MTDQHEQPGAIFEATVRDLVSDGRGIVSHPSGRTYFVAGVWPGEKIQVKITQLKGRIGFGVCQEISTPSENRTAAPCEHHGNEQGKCGGCPWQFVDYEAQLSAKQKRINDSFARIGVTEVEDIWPSEKIFGYRNRAQFKCNGKKIGYVAAQSHMFASIKDCMILTERNRQTLKRLIAKLPNSEWQPAKKQKWTTLDIDEFIDAENVSVNQRRPFLQGNDDQNIRMQNWLAEKLAEFPNETPILELFSGSGNFTKIISQLGFLDIFAVEAVEEAVEKLSEQKFSGVKPIVSNLFSEPDLNKIIKQAKTAEILVLDPPRDGLKVKGNLFQKKSKIKHVAYISCDPATLIRDITEFQKHKFCVIEVQPLDLFPHTPHVECLVWLGK